MWMVVIILWACLVVNLVLEVTSSRKLRSNCPGSITTTADYCLKGWAYRPRIFFFEKFRGDAVFVLLLLIFFSACSPKIYQGHYKIGPVYQKDGVIHTPALDLKYDKIGVASWYGKKGGFHGKKTANGDKFHKDMLTAAHPTLPMPSMVKVTNVKNHKSVILMVNDRGPFTKKRIIDVSEKAAKILDFKRHGLAKVRVEYLPKESSDLLDKLTLTPKHGYRARKKIKDAKCSVHCHIERVNKQQKSKTNQQINEVQL